MAGVKTYFILMGVAMIWQQALAAGLNNSCTSNIECTVENAECLDGFCKCKNTVEVNGLCTEAARGLGEGCDADQQCSLLLGKNVFCVSHQCACKSGFIAVRGQRCLSKQNLNDKCEAPEQCNATTTGSTCKDGICACLPEFSDAMNNKCLPDKDYGQECTERTECVKRSGDGADCIDYKCACQKENYYNNMRCLKRNGLDEVCSGTDQGCYLEKDGYKNVECVNGYCRCKSGFKNSDDGKSCESSAIERALVSIGLLLAVLVSSVSI